MISLLYLWFSLQQQFHYFMSLKKHYYSNKRKLFKYSSLFPNKTFKIYESYVKCELLTAVTIKVIILWNVTPCSQQTHANISQGIGAYFFMVLPFTRRQQVPLKLALFTQLSIIHNPMQLEDVWKLFIHTSPSNFHRVS
jgi:hypothetical protein